MQADKKKPTGMDTTPEPQDPSAIPGTDLYILPPEGVTMEDFSRTGQAMVDLTGTADEQALTGNIGGQATKPQGVASGSQAGVKISDAELSARINMFKCLDSMSKDQSILEAGYYKYVDTV